jgi:hypothetical protein
MSEFTVQRKMKTLRNKIKKNKTDKVRILQGVEKDNKKRKVNMILKNVS